MKVKIHRTLMTSNQSYLIYSTSRWQHQVLSIMNFRSLLNQLVFRWDPSEPDYPGLIHLTFNPGCIKKIWLYHIASLLQNVTWAKEQRKGLRIQCTCTYINNIVKWRDKRIPRHLELLSKHIIIVYNVTVHWQCLAYHNQIITILIPEGAL